MNFLKKSWTHHHHHHHHRDFKSGLSSNATTRTTNTTQRGVNKLFKKLHDSGTDNRRPASGRPRSAHTEENAMLLQKFPLSATDFVLPIVRWSDREHLFVHKENKVSGILRELLKQKLSALHAHFASVSSCARRLLKHFRYKSLQVIWDTDDRWMSVSRDISRTVLWACGLSSWLRTKSLSRRFLQCGHKLIVKVSIKEQWPAKILFAISMGKDSLFWTPKISKFADE